MHHKFTSLDTSRYSVFPAIDSAVREESLLELSKSFKKEEDVKKYYVDESLDDIARALYLLEHGSDMQRMSVFNNLGTLFRDHGDTAVHQITKYLSESLWKMEEEVQIACSQSFIELLPTLSEANLRKIFPLIRSMSGLKKQKVANAWSDLLVESLDFLPTDILQGECMKMGIDKSDLNQSESARLLSCKILGRLCRRLDKKVIEDMYLTQLMSMCQDTDAKVRMCMCKQLKDISYKIGVQKTKQVVATELFELLSDEERDVKNQALKALVSLIDFFDDSFRKTSIFPIFRDYMAHPPEELYKMLVRLFGKIVHKLSTEITDDEGMVVLFCGFFKDAANRSDPQLRQNCAYNFPALLQSIGGRRYGQYMHTTFRSLSDDSYSVTRRTIAAGFHEVCKILGPELTLRYLSEPLLNLLQDQILEVQDALLKHFDVILAHCNLSDESGSSYSSRNLYSAILPHLLVYQNSIKNNWRRVMGFLAHFETFATIFSVDELHDGLIPVLLNYLEEGAVPVKQRAALLIVCLSRHLNSNAKQVEVFRRIKEQFGRGASYRARMTFLDICHHVLTYFSRKFFRDNLIDTVLQIAKDEVPNVRKKFCALLPFLKRVLLPPTGDVKLLAGLNESVSFLKLDKNREVQAEALKADQILIDTEAEIGRESHLTVISEEEKQDKQKEEKERQWQEEDERNGIVVANMSASLCSSGSSGLGGGSTGSLGNSNGNLSGNNNNNTNGTSNISTLLNKKPASGLRASGGFGSGLSSGGTSSSSSSVGKSIGSTSISGLGNLKETGGGGGSSSSIYSSSGKTSGSSTVRSNASSSSLSSLRSSLNSGSSSSSANSSSAGMGSSSNSLKKTNGSMSGGHSNNTHIFTVKYTSGLKSSSSTTTTPTLPSIKPEHKMRGSSSSLTGSGTKVAATKTPGINHTKR